MWPNDLTAEQLTIDGSELPREAQCPLCQHSSTRVGRGCKNKQTHTRIYLFGDPET